METKHKCDFAECYEDATHHVALEFYKNPTLALLGFTEKDNKYYWYCDKHFSQQMVLQRGIISEINPSEPGA